MTSLLSHGQTAKVLQFQLDPMTLWYGQHHPIKCRFRSNQHFCRIDSNSCLQFCYFICRRHQSSFGANDPEWKDHNLRSSNFWTSLTYCDKVQEFTDKACDIFTWSNWQCKPQKTLGLGQMLEASKKGLRPRSVETRRPRSSWQK